MLNIMVAWFAFSAAWPQGSGSISGCVVAGDAALPGVSVAAVETEGGKRVEVVTGGDGCYRFETLRAGSYRVTASLAGFVTAARDGISVDAGREVRGVDLKLCVGPLCMLDWVVPEGPGLSVAWREAQLVARVRILGTESLDPQCPRSDVVHTAKVEEAFKGPSGVVSFQQEIWTDEPKPYALGQELVVFLGESAGAYYRVGGPHFVFRLEGERVIAPASIEAEGLTRDGLFSQLRAMAKGTRVTQHHVPRNE